jgi:hypothetical protein
MSSDSPQNQKEPLLNQIVTFRKWQYWIGVPLIIIGGLTVLSALLPGLIVLSIGCIIVLPIVKWIKKSRK